MSSGLLFLAVEAGQMDAAARLLEEDDSLVRSVNGSGQTPLHVATSKCSLPMVDLLVSYGADVNATTAVCFGGLACLHLAARFNFVHCGRALVMAGANPNVRAAGTGATPLHECARFGSLDFATWMLSIPGVEAGALDSAGFSAHYFAKKAGHVQLARMLPAIKYELWQQVEKEPQYAQNVAAVKDTLEKKARIAAKKAEALEKKKKKKPF